ncbi:c-type cytochrome [Winogradskyella haliclonae]|uniref:Cytochrome c n=1 Tax=Winogradskyella haliclonae TaxID=2048558 RepID=A0ABQ2BVR8_9FLAO|nr:cytochrome c [Winogradskyella haliclonae]GGI56552.1 cytochrome c [Winogradskyella haliclonae]
MKTTLKITVVLVMLLSIVSCNKKSRRNYQYMPNMYQSVGYEAYQESDAFANGVEAQLPVDGTIPRGYSLYDFEDSTEGYDKAKAELKSPLDSSAVDYDRGKELYDIYCGICHGNKGDGQGTLMKREKILGVPSYDTRELTEGSIYHVMYYGLNSMGSYANFMSDEERWQVVAYVEKLKADLEK